MDVNLASPIIAGFILVNSMTFGLLFFTDNTLTMLSKDPEFGCTSTITASR
jgi:hypothetical protein